MSTFAAYFRLGLAHLLDPQGYDHVLFVVALAAPYALTDWRRLLWLVTAFTVGHSVTLALATLGVVGGRAAVVEALIPATILATAALNVWGLRRPGVGGFGTVGPGGGGRRAERRRPWGRYALALGFGLIHGLGFSGFLRSVLGAEESLALPLLAFNVGLEAGQLVVLAAVLGLGAVAVRAGRIEPRAWALVASGAAGGVALVLLLERLGGGAG